MRPGVSAAVVVIGCSAGLPAAAQVPLRYNLRIGDWLAYDCVTTVRERSGRSRQTRDQLQLWCFAVENDERLLLVDRIADIDGAPQPMRGIIAYVDSAGRRRLPPESLTRVAEVEAALDLLPPLPFGVQAGPAWRSAPDDFGQRWHCRPSDTPPTHAAERVFDFELEDTTGAAAALRQTTRGRFRFDTADGVISKLERVQTDERRGVETRALATLRHRVQNEDRWCEQRVAEVQRWLRTQGQEDQLVERLLSEPFEAAAHLARLERLWEAHVVASDGRSKSPLHLLAVARRRQLNADGQRLRAAAAAAARWLSQAPPGWTLQNPAGETVTNEAQRGRIVVECFWSTESLAAVRALETMRRLQGELRPGSAELVCLNVDVDLGAALHAIAASGAGLRHVLGSSLREAEGLAELPVFRVRDREGVVRAVTIGWRPSIAERVRPLLNEPRP